MFGEPCSTDNQFTSGQIDGLLFYLMSLPEGILCCQAIKVDLNPFIVAVVPIPKPHNHWGASLITKANCRLMRK